MPKLLAQRITESLNVSGAFDNCFFHTYAMHLLANKLPLPEDLFTFKSIVGEESHASKLQARFPDAESLSLFTEYAQQHDSEQAPLSSNSIVEKTLVLGFLMREWFATKMAENQEMRDQYTPEVLLKFKQYKEFRGFMEKDDLRTGAEAVLYKANEAFLEYFTARPKVGDLTADEVRYEKYFANAENDTDKAIQAYWKAEGFQNYSRLIANPQEKLAYSDVAPVIKMQKQGLTIYDQGAHTLIHSNDGSEALPKLEITLDVGAGHYHLLKTDETASLCDEYERSLKQYMIDREAVLATRGDKDAEANAKSSLLVGAICPSGHLKKEPFAFLLDKIDGVKSFVMAQQHAEALKKEQEEQRARELADAHIDSEEDMDLTDEDTGLIEEERSDLQKQQEAALFAVTNGQPKPTEGFAAQFVNAIKYLYEGIKNALESVARAIGIK